MVFSAIKDYSLVRLLSSDIKNIISHIQNLQKEDRYLRFGYFFSDEQISQYVTNNLSDNDFQKNFWYGIFDEHHLVATLHIAVANNTAEFAFTTDKNYRGKKIGQLLFARGYQLVTEFRITKILMTCLSENSPMRHISQKFGFSVITKDTDTEASIHISYPVSLSKLNEVKLCIIDKNIY